MPDKAGTGITGMIRVDFGAVQQLGILRLVLLIHNLLGGGVGFFYRFLQSRPLGLQIRRRRIDCRLAARVGQNILSRGQGRLVGLPGGGGVVLGREAGAGGNLVVQLALIRQLKKLEFSQHQGGTFIPVNRRVQGQLPALAHPGNHLYRLPLSAGGIGHNQLIADPVGCNQFHLLGVRHLIIILLIEGDGIPAFFQAGQGLADALLEGAAAVPQIDVLARHRAGVVDAHMLIVTRICCPVGGNVVRILVGKIAVGDAAGHLSGRQQTVGNGQIVNVEFPVGTGHILLLKPENVFAGLQRNIDRGIGPNIIRPILIISGKRDGVGRFFPVDVQTQGTGVPLGALVAEGHRIHARAGNIHMEFRSVPVLVEMGHKPPAGIAGMIRSKGVVSFIDHSILGLINHAVGDCHRIHVDGTAVHAVPPQEGDIVFTLSQIQRNIGGAPVFPAGV